MASTLGASSRLSAVRKQAVAVSAASAGTTATPSPDASSVSNGLLVAEAIFISMQNAIIATNEQKKARNKRRQAHRDAGEANVPADENLQAVVDLDAFKSLLSFVPDSNAVTQSRSDVAGTNADFLSSLQASISNLSTVLAEILASLTAKYSAHDFTNAPPTYHFDEIQDNKFDLNPSPIPNSILALANLRIHIPLTMLTFSALHEIRENAGLKTVKVPFGNGAGKTVLDTSAFPKETSLNATDFLEAYRMWMVVIRHTSDDKVVECWREHYHLMISDPDFHGEFPAWYEADARLRRQWTTARPALPKVNDVQYHTLLMGCRSRLRRKALDGESIESFLANPWPTDYKAPQTASAASSSHTSQPSQYGRSHYQLRSRDHRYQPYGRDGSRGSVEQERARSRRT